MEVNLTSSSFEKEVIASDLPVLVDFWAPWCGPCQILTPVIEEVARDYSGKLKVCKLNVDDASEIATQFAIMSIPALLLFKDGNVMEKRVGVVGKDDLDKFIQPYI